MGTPGTFGVVVIARKLAARLLESLGWSRRAIRGPSALLVAGGLVLFALTSCGSSGSTVLEPIEPILDGDIEIVADRSGSSATFTVETTIPVACAVIYGTDESFGSIAVDNDMQGGAHRDHGPLLTGLSPDTEYVYILQGSDAAGTIYRSEVLSFRTPQAAETGLGVNVAPTGAVIGASSEFSTAFAAENAIDADIGTEWSTAGDGDDAWIEIDLGEARLVTAVAFRTREMTDGTALTRTFTVTIDDTVFGPYTAGRDPIVLDEPYAGRILRFDAHETTGGNTGATEIEIYTDR